MGKDPIPGVSGEGGSLKHPSMLGGLMLGG
jgi:hypothetical protein